MRIDLNADLGEGFGQWTLGDDEALLDVVTSANVACGFHAGDPTVLRRVCEQAADRGVVIGAQVGYRDLAGFGRRFIDVDPEDLVNDVLYQIGALEAFARVAGTAVAYVKPHGALYNAIVHHEEQAEAVAEAVRRYDPGLHVLGLPGSAWLATAEAAGLTPVGEAFADRAYTPAGTLVSRREPGAVLHDPEVVTRRSVRIATRGEVRGPRRQRRTRTRPGRCACTATPRARWRWRPAVRRALEEAGVELVPFAPDGTTMRVLPCADAGLLVELADLDEVLALYAELVDDPPPGVVDARAGGAHAPAPGRPRDRRPGGRGARSARGTAPAGGRPDAGHVEIPVRYDGEDLAEVGELTGLGARGVVEAHTGPGVDGRVLRLRPRLRLPGRRGRPAARAAPQHPAHQGAGRRGRAWPGSSAGSTRASRPVAGS